MAVRKIVHIEEEKCDGCGQCVPSCAEGAIRIIDGKARLISDIYCDGLGACLGHCPQDAIRIIERQADDFDEEAVHEHLAASKEPAACEHPGGGCPGSAPRDLKLNVLAQPARPATASPAAGAASSDRHSELRNWPVQLALLPPSAPFLNGAELLLTAQCAAFAMADFHERLMKEKTVAIACPKLDNAQGHLEKLSAILKASDIRSVSVARMEVPCCMGLVRIAEAAIEASGKDIPMHQVVVSTRGETSGEL